MVDSHSSQPNLLPRSSTNINPQSNTQPSFADFKFNTIGREPELLKRFTAPNPQQQYRSPSPDLEDKLTETEPKSLPRPTLLEALTDVNMPIAPVGTPAEQNQFSSTKDVAADSDMHDSDMHDDLPLSDNIAAMSAAVPPRLERQATRSQRQAPRSLSPAWASPRPPNPLGRWQTQNLPTANMSSVALSQADGLLTPSSPSFVSPVTGHDLAPLITNAAPLTYSSQKSLTSSDVFMREDPFLNTSLRCPSPCVTTSTISSNNSLHANLQYLQTRIQTYLTMLDDLSPPTPSSTPLEASPIALALRLAQSTAQSSISQADMSIRAAQSSYNLVKSLINVGQEAFSSAKESLEAAEAAHVIAQRSREAIQETLSASNISLSDAEEAKRKADEAMRAVERVGEEIKKKEESMRMREEDISAREEKVRKAAAETKEVVETIRMRVREFQERVIVEGEARRRLEFDATRRQLDEREKGQTVELEAGVVARGTLEKESRAEEERRNNEVTVAGQQQGPSEDTVIQTSLDQDMADPLQEGQLEMPHGFDAQEVARQVKETETLRQRDQEREDELRKEQEKKRAEVMAQKQRANQEAGAKIRAEREARERVMGDCPIPTAPAKGPPISPRKGVHGTSNVSPTHKGSNFEFWNAMGNRLPLPDAPRAAKALHGQTGRGQGKNYQLSDMTPGASIYPVQSRVVEGRTISSQSQPLKPLAVAMAARGATSSDDFDKLTNGASNLISDTTRIGNPVSGDLAIRPTALAADRTSRNFITNTSPSPSSPVPQSDEPERGTSGSSGSSPFRSEVPPPLNSSHPRLGAESDLAFELEISNAPQEVNIGPVAIMSPVAQATNLRHLTNTEGVNWNKYSLPMVTVKKESREGMIEPTHRPEKSRTGSVTVLPTFDDSRSPSPSIATNAQLQRPTVAKTSKRLTVAPQRANKPPKGKGTVGTGFEVKSDPGDANVAIPQSRDNHTAANVQTLVEHASRRDAAGRSHSNSSSGRHSDAPGGSRSDTRIVNGAAFSDGFTNNGEVGDDRRGHTNPIVATRPTDDHDSRRWNETRVPFTDDRRGPPFAGLPFEKRFRGQKRAHDHLSTQDGDHERSSHPTMPNHLKHAVASRAVRGYDHWSPSPSMTASNARSYPPRIPPSPSPPLSRKRLREDNSRKYSIQSLGDTPRYEDTGRERWRNYPRIEPAAPTQRQEPFDNNRSYRPVRSLSPRSRAKFSPPQRAAKGHTPVPEDFGKSAYSSQGGSGSGQHSPQIYYQDSNVIGNSQPQQDPSTNTASVGWPASGSVGWTVGGSVTQTAEVAPTTEKIDLLSRMSDKARPLPVGPSRGTLLKRGSDRPHFQPRGAPFKPRGRGSRSLHSRITLEDRITGFPAGP